MVAAKRVQGRVRRAHRPAATGAPEEREPELAHGQVDPWRLHGHGFQLAVGFHVGTNDVPTLRTAQSAFNSHRRLSENSRLANNGILLGTDLSALHLLL